MVDIEQLSKLARIKLDGDEKKKLQKEFEDILGYVSKLKEVDLTVLTSDISAGQVKNVMREDAGAHNKKFFSKELLEAAPSVERSYVKVKHVFN